MTELNTLEPQQKTPCPPGHNTETGSRGATDAREGGGWAQSAGQVQRVRTGAGNPGHRPPSWLLGWDLGDSLTALNVSGPALVGGEHQLKQFLS